MIRSSARQSIQPVVQTILVDVAPPLVAYYGLRALGASEYVALLSATILSGIRVFVGVCWSRRLDPFAGYLLLTFGLSLVVGLASTDAKTVLIGNSAVNVLGGLIFLGSCVFGTPLTQAVSMRFRSAPHENAAEAHHQRRIHVRLSAMWGVGLLLEVVARVTVIEALSVDVATSVVSAISLGVLGLLALATIFVTRRNAPTDSAPSPPLGADR